MKRVRYMMGAAGLAPAAFGMAALPVVTAAAAPGANGQAAASVAGGQGKTVSLHHARAVTPDAGCTGHTEFTIARNGNIRGHGWYTNGTEKSPNGRIIKDVCIGTVVNSLNFTKSFCKTGSLDASGDHFYNLTRRICADKNLWVPISWGLHKIFTTSVDVCIFSQYHTTGDCKRIT
jgi:hypothetical protein